MFDRLCMAGVICAFVAAIVAPAPGQDELPGTIACWTPCGDGGLYLLNPDGSEVRQVRQMTRVYEGPRLCPDRTMLAYVRAAGAFSKVFVCDPEGNETCLTEEVGSWGALSWSADGTRLLAARAPLPTYPPAAEPAEPTYYWLPLDGSNPETVPWLKGEQATLSANGQTAAWIQRNTPKGTDIWLSDADGTGAYNLTNHGSEYFADSPAISPDGGQIAYVRARSPTGGATVNCA